jgi:branched-chain amino acid transport system ATP-binding protein
LGGGFLLEVNNIDVFYGEVPVLRNVSLKVNEGEIIAIIGSNGAGKTTILKTISGILCPATGNIKFLGKNIEKLPPHRIVELGISHVMEGRRLFPYMSVLENLELGTYTKRARKKIKNNLELVFNLFPVLKERKKQMAKTLSGGEQQMLAIARALMSSPKLLLLDEPSLGLAPNVVIKVFETLKEINNHGVTILLVEQNVAHALRLASRAYVLETGRITLEGEGENLLHNDYVKIAFLGI